MSKSNPFAKDYKVSTSHTLPESKVRLLDEWAEIAEMTRSELFDCLLDLAIDYLQTMDIDAEANPKAAHLRESLDEAA